jgi:hypothetical protein
MTQYALNVRNGSVIRLVMTVCRPLPVFLDKQTFSESVDMSLKCQHATSRLLGHLQTFLIG